MGYPISGPLIKIVPFKVHVNSGVFTPENSLLYYSPVLGKGCSGNAKNSLFNDIIHF